MGTALREAEEAERREEEHRRAQAEGQRSIDEDEADEDAPRAHRHVAAAVRAGVLGIEAAQIITRTLEAIDADAPESGDLDELERRLVERAQRLSLPDLRRMCRRQEAFRSPRDVERKERLQRSQRYLAFSEDATGMVSMHAKMDPATAAPIRAWLDAQVRAALHRRRDEPGEDPRDPGQMRIDALATLASHGLDCDQPTSGVKTTVVVHATAEDLARGEGLADCESLSDPISIATLRRMAVDAEIVPAVMGGTSLPLDLGRSERLFSRAQRIALAVRDGGCAWCHAPASWCEAHHIDWWGRDHGPTDLRNGVLLCVSCHHRVHDGGWELTVIDDDVWFTPPRGIDPEQRPRIGGRAHLDTISP